MKGLGFVFFSLVFGIFRGWCGTLDWDQPPLSTLPTADVQERESSVDLRLVPPRVKRARHLKELLGAVGNVE